MTVLMAAFSATLPVLPEVKTGATVSILIFGALPESRPLFPAASLNEPDTKVMLAVPLFRAGVGENTAVRVRPLPLMAPKLPFLTTKSLLVKLLPGSSLKVKVMVAVWPIPNKALLLAMVTVGERVSMLMDGTKAPLPTLPERSA